MYFEKFQDESHFFADTEYIHQRHLDEKDNSASFSFSDWLDSPEHDTMTEQYKTAILVRTVSALISFISSITLAVVVVRSNTGLSSTFHRLLIGICISDILSSSASTFAAIMAPKELKYISHLLRGNMAICDVIGSLYYFGAVATALYNTSLCLYSLAVVKFKKNDTFIRQRIEPIMHIVCLVLPLAYSLTLLCGGYINSRGQGCALVKYEPPHCLGVESGVVPEPYPGFDYAFEIPCGRGSGARNVKLFVHIPVLCFIFITIISSMTLVYRVVLGNEKKMQMYGARAFKNSIARRKSITKESEIDMNAGDGPAPRRRKSFIEKIKSSQLMSKADTTTTSPSRSQSQTVLYKASAYSCAWFVTYVGVFLQVFTSSDTKGVPYYADIVQSLLFPLQGFFNFVIYMYPNVIHVKRTDPDAENLTWFRAFLKALMVKGNMQRKRKSGPSISSRFASMRKKRRRSSVDDV